MINRNNLELRESRMESFCLLGTEFQFGRMKNHADKRVWLNTYECI